MNWSKAKTILIVYFIIINIFFLAYIIYDGLQLKETEEKVADAVIELLSDNGISVDKKIILRSDEQENMKTVYVENIIKSYDEFAKLVLGEDAVKKSSQAYWGELGEIKFSGDYFEASAASGKYLMANSVSKSNAAELAEEYIVSIGVEPKGLDSAVLQPQENGGYTVHFEKTENSMEVFGAGISAELDSGGIKKLSGCWYNRQDGDGALMELKEPSGMLIEYMNSRKDKKNCLISDIRLGYATLESQVYHEGLVLTPMWQITEDNGKKTYINAREI